MDEKYLVEIALKVLRCNQAELALRLGVSPTQITKWKQGEHMSSEMDMKIRDLTGLGESDARFVFKAGSIEAAQKWGRLIDRLAEDAAEAAETGYNTVPLMDDLSALHSKVFHSFEQLGVEIPQAFPRELDFDYEKIYSHEIDDSENERLSEILSENIYANSIYAAFLALNDLYGFFSAYMEELIYNGNEALFEAGENIEPCLLELAFCKIDLDEKFAPKFSEFRYKTLQSYKEWIESVKIAAFKEGIPLRAELMHLVTDSHGEIGHEAEFESLGFSSSRLHPDIYMNEILCSLRTIHQVLPVIMKKLGITEDEFKLDESDFHL